MTLNTFLIGYEKFLKTQNKMDNTISLYLRDITIYLYDFKRVHNSIPHSTLSTLLEKKELLTYFEKLKEPYKDKNDPMSINKFYRTLSRKISGFSKFLDFLVREQLIEINFLRGFDRTDLIKKNREVISRNYTKWIPQEELVLFVKALTACAQSSNSLNVHRDSILVLLLIFTGLRATEVTRIKIEDVDLGNCCIKNVLRKRRNYAEIPIERKHLGPLLENYIKLKKIDSDNRLGYLFTKKEGVQIDRYLVYRVVLKYSKKLLGREIHPHILRHTFATIMCMNGANISDVRDMLDHKSISSTEIYEHVNKIKNKYDVINNFDLG